MVLYAISFYFGRHSVIERLRKRLRDTIEQHEERISLLSVMGIEITEDNKADYIATLRKCLRIALINGFIDEYEMIKQKLNLIEAKKRDGHEKM